MLHNSDYPHFMENDNDWMEFDPETGQTHDWYGRLVSFDNTDKNLFKITDIVEVYLDTEDYAFFKLNDGRYITWETFWDVTGSGFHADAYGGDSDVVFSSSYEFAVNFGLTDEGRRVLNG